MAKMAELTNELQVSLQKAEAYGDDLRNKLRQTDLSAMAQKDPETLEGKMNGATAKLWREFMSDTGNTNDYPIPDWLQQTRERNSDSNTDNIDEFIAEFTEIHGDLAFVALSINDYENLALNIADIRRFINQQDEIIVYYEKAVTDDEEESVPPNETTNNGDGQ
jgi:hypothetical protein